MALKQTIPLHRKQAGRGVVVCVVIIAILYAGAKGFYVDQIVGFAEGIEVFLEICFKFESKYEYFWN